MSSNVGLSTPRGSGTSGYVQRNLSALKPRSHHSVGQPYPPRDSSSLKPLSQRQPDKAILKHQQERQVEVRVMELRDELEDEGLKDEEIDERCEKLREELLGKMNSGDAGDGSDGRRRDGGKDTGKDGAKGRYKTFQVHEMAAEKAMEQERLRKALGIGKDYVEGEYWERRDRERAEKERMFTEEKEGDK